MLAIAYSGSFIMMEETAEKTEKTEKSEEALHSIYHASGLQRTIIKKRREAAQFNASQKDSFTSYGFVQTEQNDYNISHIYLSSYLRLQV